MEETTLLTHHGNIIVPDGMQGGVADINAGLLQQEPEHILRSAMYRHVERRLALQVTNRSGLLASD